MKRPKTPQTFCIYCQEDYETPAKLHEHILKEHQHSYAHENIVSITGIEQPYD